MSAVLLIAVSPPIIDGTVGKGILAIEVVGMGRDLLYEELDATKVLVPLDIKAFAGLLGSISTEIHAGRGYNFPLPSFARGIALKVRSKE